MEHLRIHIDTSVLGGCFDPEFAPWSNGLMSDFRARRLAPVLSDVTAAANYPDVFAFLKRIHGAFEKIEEVN